MNDTTDVTTDDYLYFAVAYSITNGTAYESKSTNHGYIVLGVEKAAAGDTITLTLNPDSDYRYKEYSLKVIKTDGGEEVAYTTLEKNKTYHFVMPEYGVTVSAEFEESPAPAPDAEKNDPAVQGYDTEKGDNTEKDIKTGDENNILFYGLTAVFSLLGMGLVYGLKRKVEK